MGNIRMSREGKIYDTQSAEKVVEIKWTSRYGLEFNDERTALYLSPGGRWFIAGEGGCWSRWGKDNGPHRDPEPGKGLELLSADEARDLLEKADGELVELYFDLEEG